MPIKGFQYLLPLPRARCVGGTDPDVLDIWSQLTRRIPRWRTAVQNGALVLTVLTLIVPAWLAVRPPSDREFLAGSGGLPAGREAGTWIDNNIPAGLDPADHRTIDGKRHSFLWSPPGVRFVG